MRQLIIAACLFAGPAWAENVLDSHFGNSDLKSASCFVRSYSAAHLTSHPDQMVTDVAVMLSPLSPGGKKPMLDVFVSLRGDPYEYHGVGYCNTKGDDLNCLLEGDAGAFSVTGEKNGVLRLTVARRGMAFEGDKFVEISGMQGDDRVFLIPNVPAEFCN